MPLPDNEFRPAFFLLMTVVSIYKVCVSVVGPVLDSWGEKKGLQSGKLAKEGMVPEDCMIVMESQFSIQNYMPFS